MDFEDISQLINQAALQQKGRPLKDVERLVLKGAWENQTYSAMANLGVGYSDDYLKKDVGPKLWRLLSELVDPHRQEMKVTKHNLRNVLQTWARDSQGQPSWDGARRIADGPPAALTVRDLPWIDSSRIYGREVDLAILAEWLQGGPSGEYGRLLLIWGLPGQGKTTLALHLALHLQDQFDRVGYLDLPDGVTDTQVMAALTTWLCPPGSPPPQDTAPIDWLMAQLTRRRCLLVIDHLESLFIPSQLAGTYVAHTEATQLLLQRTATAQHRSTWLCLSQEKPADLALWLGPRVRDYGLSDLPSAALPTLLQKSGNVVAQPEDYQILHQRYGSSPLVLQGLARLIQEVYQGQLPEFLAEPTVVLPDLVRQNLATVLERISEPELGVLYWLAQAQAPLSLTTLAQVMIPYPGTVVVQSLIGRSLCWGRATTDSTQLDLPPLVRSMVLSRLLAVLVGELKQGELHWFHRLPLVTVTAPAAVQAQQRATLLEPLASQWRQGLLVEADLRVACDRLLQAVRYSPLATAGYGPANLLHLWGQLGIDLGRIDLSQLALWQADLTQVNLQGANLSHAHLQDTALAMALQEPPVAVVSPEQDWLVVGDTQGQMLIWSITTGQLYQRLEIPEPPVAITTLALSPEAEMLAVGTASGGIWLWSLAHPLLSPGDGLSYHQSRLTALAFSPQGGRLASADQTGVICLWDLASGGCHNHWQGHQEAIHTLVFNLGGDRLLSSGEDQTTCLWSVSRGECQVNFQPRSTASVRAAGFLPPNLQSGQTELAFAAGYDDYGLVLWAVETGQPHWVQPTDIEGLLTLAVSSGGDYLAASRQDGSLTLWPLAQGRAPRTLSPLSAPAWVLNFSPNGDSLVSASDQGVQVWQVTAAKLQRSFVSRTYPLTSLAFNRHYLLTGHRDGGLRRWLMPTSSTQANPTGQVPDILTSPTQGGTKALAVSDAGGVWARAGNDQTLVVGQVADGQVLHRSHLPSPATLLHFSSDGEWLAGARADGVISLWSAATGYLLGEMDCHPSAPTALQFNRPGPYPPGLFSGGRDGIIWAWDLDHFSGKEIFRGHQRQVHSLALNSTGTCLASASYDGTVRWWDTARETCLGTWLAPTDHWLHAVAIDARDQILVITSQAGQLAVWLVQTNQCCYQLQGHRQGIWLAMVKDGGRLLITASQDSEIRLWDLKRGICQQVWHPSLPYTGMDITATNGLSSAATSLLSQLGAEVNASTG